VSNIQSKDKIAIAIGQVILKDSAGLFQSHFKRNKAQPLLRN